MPRYEVRIRRQPDPTREFVHFCHRSTAISAADEAEHKMDREGWSGPFNTVARAEDDYWDCEVRTRFALDNDTETL